MFEAKSKPLLPRPKYYARLVRSAAIGLAVILTALGIGMLGYHYFENMPWIDAFANAAMILSGMGPFAPLTTTGGTPDKPVGMVCFAWAAPGVAAKSVTKHFDGDRESVRRQSVIFALQGVLECLEG